MIIAAAATIQKPGKVYSANNSTYYILLLS